MIITYFVQRDNLYYLTFFMIFEVNEIANVVKLTIKERQHGRTQIR